MSLELFLYNKISENFGYEPTTCQEELFHSLSSFVVAALETDIMVINGYAGTGKTTVLASFVKTLKGFNIPFRLMAPTGRSAKVLANYTGESSYTIHKQIYRQKSLNNGVGEFQLNVNKSKETIFIVDEASLISTYSFNSPFGSGNLLDDLITFVRSGVQNRLILVGDNAQLPPISLDKSPALDIDFLSQYGNVHFSELHSVVRQAEESGILYNATLLRKAIESSPFPQGFPKLSVKGFPDIELISGGELIEKIADSIDKFGIDETVVLCRSNKRANRYNSGIRSTILFREEQLTKGDKIMVVKNCYQFLEEIKELDFIANGDVAELMRISRYEERYGLHFAQATLSFPDYNDIEITAKIILDTLSSETASLSQEQQTALYEGVYADYEHVKGKRKRNASVREDLYYNALQIKYATAITCHKSQGGQWKSVFIDNAFWGDEITLDDLKWLYTAITRAVDKVYLVNLNKNFYE